MALDQEAMLAAGGVVLACITVLFVRGFLSGRVLSQGQMARARVLSVREAIVGDQRIGTRIYTVVYEVTLEGQAPFRVRGEELMDFMAIRANPLVEGGWANVRFNARRTMAVLERVPTEGVDDMIRREEREAREKEEAFLRGPPR